MTDVEFPAMRREVASALSSLVDLEYQERAWIHHQYSEPVMYDDLTLNVNILYDDTQVFPDPKTRLGTVLLPGDEVDALCQVADTLGSLLDRLGEADDAEYLASPEWPELARRSAVALAAMVRRGGCL